MTKDSVDLNAMLAITGIVGVGGLLAYLLYKKKKDKNVSVAHTSIAHTRTGAVSIGRKPYFTFKNAPSLLDNLPGGINYARKNKYYK